MDLYNTCSTPRKVTIKGTDYLVGSLTPTDWGFIGETVYQVKLHEIQSRQAPADVTQRETFLAQQKADAAALNRPNIFALWDMIIYGREACFIPLALWKAINKLQPEKNDPNEFSDLPVTPALMELMYWVGYGEDRPKNG